MKTKTTNSGVLRSQRIAETRTNCGRHYTAYWALSRMTTRVIITLMISLSFLQTRSTKFAQPQRHHRYTTLQFTQRRHLLSGLSSPSPKLTAAPNKTCQLDPTPTWLVKDMRGLLSPFMCLFGKAPVYLSNCCIPVAQVATRQHLHAVCCTSSADRSATSSQHLRS